jgi:multiple sugar transport system ATP-binding protein
MTMADRIAVIRDGWIEQLGAPLELYDRPANQFVAGFIGSPSMNFIQGLLQRNGSDRRFVTEDGIALPLPIRGGEDGQKVFLGIRPEHLELAAGETGLPLSVAVVEPTGAETLIVGRLGKHSLQVVLKARHSFSPGQQIRLNPVAGAVHLFDSAKGQRLQQQA